MTCPIFGVVRHPGEDGLVHGALGRDEKPVRGDDAEQLISGQVDKVPGFPEHLLKVGENEVLGVAPELIGAHGHGVQVQGDAVLFVDALLHVFTADPLEIVHLEVVGQAEKVLHVQGREINVLEVHVVDHLSDEGGLNQIFQLDLRLKALLELGEHGFEVEGLLHEHILVHRESDVLDDNGEVTVPEHVDADLQRLTVQEDRVLVVFVLVHHGVGSTHFVGLVARVSKERSEARAKEVFQQFHGSVLESDPVVNGQLNPSLRLELWNQQIRSARFLKFLHTVSRDPGESKWQSRPGPEHSSSHHFREQKLGLVLLLSDPSIIS